MVRKAKIYSCPEKCMKGAELRRLREGAGLSQEQLAEKMKDWGWYRGKLSDVNNGFERIDHFCLEPREMQALLDALEVTTI